MGKPDPKPPQVHFHENDHYPDNPHPEDSTQAMVHECLTDGGIDPSDIDTVMSALRLKVENHLKILQGRSKLNRSVFARANQFKRGLAPKHTNLVGLRVETSLSLLWCSAGRSQSNNNKIYSSKDSKDSTIKQSFMEQNTSCGLTAEKVVEVLP